MKRLAVFLLIVLSVLLCKAPPNINYYTNLKTHYSWLERQELQRQNELDKFLFHLSLRESSHEWKVINRFGYMGLYQMGTAALKDLGVYNITPSRFEANPHIFPEDMQKKLVIRLLDRNKQILSSHWMYVGCTIQNVKITKSGILAAAHLAGAGNVKKFLDSQGQRNFADGNGTTVIDYLQEFANYKF